MKRNLTAVSFCQKYLLSLILLLLPTAFLFAQQVLEGRVVDATSNQGLAGASILIKGSSRGTSTDSLGNFKISAAKGEILQISSTSHQPQEVRVNNTGLITVFLTSNNSQLGEVVVIGYGSRQRKDVTGAISQVTAKDIEKSTALSPELALQGRAAGVFINSGGGDPQARPTVRIRGVNTFGYAEPLYVVDGIPIYEGGAGSSSSSSTGDIRSPINIMTQINPQDIESISVLKDASSAAIYGVRASNGVILITTKKGKLGRPKVDVSSSFGVQNITKTYSALNTQQYFDLVKEAYNANPNGSITFEAQNGPLYDASSPLYVGNNPTYNWQKDLLNKNATMQEHNIRISGGSEGTTYYVSTGYAKQESPLKANDMLRYNIAANIDTRVSKFLSAGITLRLVQQNALVNTGTDLTSLAAKVPFQPIYDPSDPSGFQGVSTGSFVPNPDYDASKIDAGPLFNFAPGDPKLLWGPQSGENTFAFQRYNDNKYDIMKAMGNAYVQIEPISGLKIKGSLGGDWFTNLRKSWTDYDMWRFSQTPGNPYSGHNGQAEGRLMERRGTNYNLYKELTVNYNRIFAEEHSVDVILSASDQFAKWSWVDLSGNVNDLDPQYRGISNQPPFTQGSSSILQEDALIGYMARVSYKFSDKYYVDATLRYDGSSRLAPGHNWDYFPAFAVAWRISSEKFFPKVDFINDVKIRGGWGQLGNFQSAGYYKYLSGVNGSPDYPLGSGNGNGNGTQTQAIRLPDFANLNLQWEKLKTINAGIDAMLFNNKISFTAEYYDKTTFDIIQGVSLPPNTGIQSQADLNIAQVKNSGFELQLGYNDKLGPVNFNVSGNFTTVKNRVQKLNGGTPLGGETGRIEEGYSMNYLWMYQVGGVFQSQAEIDAWRSKYADVSIGQSLTNAAAGYQYKPGDMYFTDVYGNPRNSKERYSPFQDSIINTSDRAYVGKTIPGFYYGLNIGANYKGIDISIFFQGVGNVQKYNGVRSGLEGMGGLANQLTTVLDRWTPSNPSSTMPRAVFNNPSNPSRNSTRYVENAGYLRLKNVQIGYTLPRTLLSKAGFIQNLRLYASGINLFTVTEWTGLDPENDGVPITRQFTFGVNATF
ncbi:SusC/RagA family TonB-linked outer membrane protein [Flavitalea sp.]|nr:TonB-dependent receptor [Flavitalea sp.]